MSAYMGKRLLRSQADLLCPVYYYADTHQLAPDVKTIAEIMMISADSARQRLKTLRKVGLLTLVSEVPVRYLPAIDSPCGQELSSPVLSRFRSMQLTSLTPADSVSVTDAPG